MADLQSLVDACGSTNIPGIAVRTYWIQKDDIDVFPARKVTTGQGDSVTLDGNIVLLPLKAFKEIDLVTDSGEVKSTMVGPVGSRSFENTMDLILPTLAPATAEFHECNANQCLVLIVKQKDGNFRVLGDPDSPAYFETVEGASGKTSGNTSGFTDLVKDTTGKVAPFYEGTIDLDPLT